MKIPSLAGQTALRIGAIRDKQERLDAIRHRPRNDRETPYEMARLALHAADLVLVREMLEAGGTLPELADLCREHTEIRDAARAAADWFDDHDGDRALVSTPQPALSGSPDPLQDALRI